MPTNAATVRQYLDNSLLQLAAESYLHKLDFANGRSIGVKS